ncbi:MAG: PAS domain-containing sensor histidine kinase, partial [Candidatus Omnitrophota bacterium]
MNYTNIRLARLFPVVSIISCFFVFCISALVLVGWALDIHFFISVWSNLAPMTPNTALCFILLSIALATFSHRSPRVAAVRLSCALTVMVLGVLTIVEYVSHIPLVIDAVLFPEAIKTYTIGPPGRMSSFAALNFSVAGIAVILLELRARWSRSIAETLLLLIGTLGLLTIIGYVFSTPDLYSFRPLKPMALHTAVSFLLVCVAAFFSRLDCDLMSVLTSDTEGGIMARRMLWVVIGVPFLLGWLVLSGERLHFFNPALGVSLLTMLTIVVFTFFIWENALSLHMIDLKRMKTEDVLRDSEDKYRTIFEVTGTAIAILDEDTTISLVNTEFAKLCGYTKFEVEGVKSWAEFVSTTKDQERMKEYSRLRRIDPAHAPRNYEFKFVDRTGRVKDVFLTIAMIPNTKKSIASLQDITERKRIEQMKSDFVSMVSHQLKTPVAQVKDYIYNMLSGLTGELTSRQREYLEDMREISNKNYRMLSDLLNISRIERGVISLDIRPVALKEIVDEAVTPLYEQIKAKGLQIQIDGLEQDIIVTADREKIVEALGNAIHNALKFTAQGFISVRVSCKETVAVIAVIDTGNGIPQDRLDRMFSR